MPYLDIKIKDAKSLPEELREFAEWIYGADCFIESKGENSAQLQLNVPGDLSQEDFESDMKEWCDEHDCVWKLIDQTPEAPSRQYFAKNTKLMYPRAKDYEALNKTPNRMKIALRLWKENWGEGFDPENPDDREDIVALFNEYMDELGEWKPVIVEIKWGKEKEDGSL